MTLASAAAPREVWSPEHLYPSNLPSIPPSLYPSIPASLPPFCDPLFSITTMNPSLHSLPFPHFPLSLPSFSFLNSLSYLPSLSPSTNSFSPSLPSLALPLLSPSLLRCNVTNPHVLNSETLLLFLSSTYAKVI